MTPQSAVKDKSSPTNSGKFEQSSLQFSTEFVNMNGDASVYSSPFEESAPSYSKFEQNSLAYSETNQSDLNLTPSQVKEETTLCQKSKETCSSGNSLVAKFKEDPALLTKFTSNSNLLAKIFQDQRVIMKIMTDPDMATCLAADPHIARFLEEHGVDSTTDAGDNKTVSQPKEVLKNSSSSSNVTTPKIKGSHVENPILTDLITNRNTEECKNQNSEPGTSTDWNKKTADVTRDVLQDVQRYARLNFAYYVLMILIKKMILIKNK